MKLDYKRRLLTVLSVITISIVTTACQDISEDTKLIEDKGGDLVIKDSLIYKPKRVENDILINGRLEDILRKLDQEKVEGIYTTDGQALVDTGGDLDVVLNPNFYIGKGLMSISNEQKSKFKINDSTLQDMLRQSGLSLSVASMRYPRFRQASNDNLLTSFDLRSPGHFLTAEQWIYHMRKLKEGNKGKVYTYKEGGQTVTRHQADQLEIVIKSIYKASHDMTVKGKPVNPDFLVALSMNETGWGSNKLSRDRNSWFSYMAYNENVDAAEGYNTPYDATVKIIDRLFTNYLSQDGKFYIDEKGPTIFGSNTKYAKEDGITFPNYTWSTAIASIMRSAFKTHNYNPPTF